MCVGVCVYKEADRQTDRDGEFAHILQSCLVALDYLTICAKKKKTILEPHANITE